MLLFIVRSAINSSFLTKPGGDTVQDECPMRRSQPASQDSEDADTVATADCSRWRNGVERQARPDAHAHQLSPQLAAAQPTESDACVLAQPLG